MQWSEKGGDTSQNLSSQLAASLCQLQAVRVEKQSNIFQSQWGKAANLGELSLPDPIVLDHSLPCVTTPEACHGSDYAGAS